jgi:hypothetical protein
MTDFIILDESPNRKKRWRGNDTSMNMIEGYRQVTALIKEVEAGNKKDKPKDEKKDGLNPLQASIILTTVGILLGPTLFWIATWMIANGMNNIHNMH